MALQTYRNYALIRMKRIVKYYAVCPSGNTDADTILHFPDRDTAELACDIWRTAHPHTRPYVREVRHIPNNDLGLVRMTIETF